VEAKKDDESDTKWMYNMNNIRIEEIQNFLNKKMPLEGVRIAFARARDILLMNSDGSKCTLVYAAGDDIRSLLWSDDRKYFICSINKELVVTDLNGNVRATGKKTDEFKTRKEYIYNLYNGVITRINIETLEETTVTRIQEYPLYFQVSPNGKYLAFITTKNNLSKLFLISADGKEAVLLAEEYNELHCPFWNKKGDVLCFAGRKKKEETYKIYCSKNNLPVVNEIFDSLNKKFAIFRPFFNSEEEILYYKNYGDGVIVFNVKTKKETATHCANRSDNWVYSDTKKSIFYTVGKVGEILVRYGIKDGSKEEINRWVGCSRLMLSE
jgi:hypothetical protein